jgi:hypothetical protein
MSLRRTTAGLLAAAATAMLLVVGACSTTGGVAVRSTTATPGTTGSTAGTAGTSASSVGTSLATSLGSGGPSPTRPVPPPTCSETPNKLVPPSGVPIITVTQGANSWITNSATEPLAIALYADGSGLASDDIGQAVEPLASMRLGYVPSCLLDWAKTELQQLAGADMGDPGITDQGTTVVTYRPAAGAAVKISVYALGSGDEYALSGKENRARVAAVLAALRKPFHEAAIWTPNRLKIVAVPAPVASGGPALVWPGAQSLDDVLVDKRGGQRCGVVSGADAAAVLKTLGQRTVYARWTDAGKVVGLNIGALVPGQDPCPAR